MRLIGATTHNPFFFVNSPLVSRSQIFELRPLTEEDLFNCSNAPCATKNAVSVISKFKVDENAIRISPPWRRRRAQMFERARNRRAHHESRRGRRHPH
jgi:replication-associated recombination protein RarA